jgi:flagellar hook assembly protein FlgD
MVAEVVTLLAAGDGTGTAELGAAGLEIVLSDGTRLRWDGRDAGGALVPNGSYIVRVTSRLPDGRERVSSAVVAVSRAYVRVIEEGVLVPNPAAEAVWISYRLADAAANLEVRIYTVAGELVYKGNSPGTARSFRWDLRNRNGERVADGLYVIELRATDPATGLPDRRILKLAVTR